jgi:23S rRNA pseudouridine2605 synthase
VLIRLQKIISEAGISSRRGAEVLIAEGKVSVNGVTVTEPGTKADPEKDVIKVNGRTIKSKPEKIYIMMNKPAGYVTTMKDPEGRPIVTQLLKGVDERVYPVGRLDYDTTGLLLFTNDGETANRLTHPRHEVLKTYRVKIKGRLSEHQLEKIRRENKKLGFRAPREVRVEPASRPKGPTARGLTKNSWIVITISEGKNRQIKRMCESVGGTALKLVRVSFGKLGLGGLKTGEFRRLTLKEEQYLKSL